MINGKYESLPELLIAHPGATTATLGLGQTFTFDPADVSIVAIPYRFFVAILHLQLEPMKRITSAGRFSKKAKDGYRYRDDLRKAFHEEGLVFAPGETIVALKVEHYRALPKSCFGKDGQLNEEGLRRAGTGASTKPDCSNVLKEIEDALTSEDETICDVQFIKRWNCTDRHLTRVTIKIAGLPNAA
jgi:Holliday junction resolvase RusA-like endonuclease